MGTPSRGEGISDCRLKDVRTKPWARKFRNFMREDIKFFNDLILYCHEGYKYFSELFQREAEGN